MFYKKNSEKELSKELFKNPTSEYRAAPFWAWNCKMDNEMLGEQIDFFKEMGFGGFHMHSRAGMAMRYLKKEFMDLVKFCTDKAKKEKMLSYLYDEDRWSSGAAGGYVTKNKRFRERYLVITQNKTEHFSAQEAISEAKPYLLATFDIVLNADGELESYERISEEAAPKGKKWYFYVAAAKEDPWFNNQTYLDTLNKEAVDEFVKITGAAYKDAVGSEFGKTVPSIFTDEPHFAAKVPLGFADSNENAELPWSFGIEKTFEERYGYDIIEKLPEVIWNLPGGEASYARYDYHDHICETFAENFADNYGKWCKENGLALTGHMLEEDNLQAQTRVLGEAMRSYRAFEVPGIDMLCNHFNYATAKQCQSAVHQYGRDAMMSELYGVTNWDFDFRGHKSQGDWQAALGVTLRVPHLSWVSMAGQAKRDYPASISYQSPWFKEYKYIEDHFARLNTALTRGKPVVKVGVIHPVESFWLHFGPAENTADIREQLDKKFSDIIEWLIFGTIDFDFIAESLLPNQYKESESGLCVGEMKYDAVIVPDCETLRGTTLEILKKFKAAGGRVIFAGSCPKYIDARPSRAAEKLYGESVCVAYDKIAVLDALKDFRLIKIKNANGKSSDNLIYNMREDNGCRWLFIAHGKNEYEPVVPAQKKRDTTDGQMVKIYIEGEHRVELYNTLTGEISEIPCEISNGKTVIDYVLYGGDSLLLKLTGGKAVKAAEKTEERMPDKTFRIMERVEYKREEPNVLLLDRAEYSLDGGEFNGEEEILILDNLCRKKMGWPVKGDSMAQPWVIEEEPITHYLTLRFKINSEISVEGAALAIEDAETLEIILNGENVPAKVSGWFVDKCIKTVKLPEIKAGVNELEIKVPFGKRTNTEWCYILGEFDVKVEGLVSTIVPKRDKIGFSPLSEQGMPFYGGNIVYKTEIETPECDIDIQANCYRGALIKVYADGKEIGPIVFSPYRIRVENLSKGRHTLEFKLFGTRINTFGGMHNVAEPMWVGPNYWRSKGEPNVICAGLPWGTKDEYWKYEYSFKETGIIASPIISIYEK